jgi:hypothetical protein
MNQHVALNAAKQTRKNVTTEETLINEKDTERCFFQFQWLKVEK